MPRKCCIEGCSNSEHSISVTLGSKISFHSFPKDKDSKLNWKHYIRVCNNQEVTGKYICSAHFHSSDIIKQQSKTMLKSFAVPKIFPNSSLLDDAQYAQGTIELPVFVSVDESPIEVEPDQIPSTIQMKQEINIDTSEDSDEIMDSDFVSLNETTYEPNRISTFPIKGEIIESVAPCDPVTTSSTSKVFRAPAFVVNAFSDEKNQITSEIDDDSSAALSDSSGDCEIVEPPNRSTSTFVSGSIIPSNLAMCPSLNPPMHPSLSMNTNMNVVKGVLLSEYEMPKRKAVVRYAGDIDEFADITLDDARRNLSFCKTKIKAQAKEINRLKQNVRRQKEQIQKMKDLLKQFKANYGLSVRAVRSIDEVVKLE